MKTICAIFCTTDCTANRIGAFFIALLYCCIAITEYLLSLTQFHLHWRNFFIRHPHNDLYRCHFQRQRPHEKLHRCHFSFLQMVSALALFFANREPAASIRHIRVYPCLILY